MFVYYLENTTKLNKTINPIWEYGDAKLSFKVDQNDIRRELKVEKDAEKVKAFRLLFGNQSYNLSPILDAFLYEPAMLNEVKAFIEANRMWK